MKHSDLNSRRLYLRLLRYVKPYWKVLALSIFLLSLMAMTEPVFPALMKPLLDEGFTNKNEVFMQWIPIVMVALFLFRGILGFTSKYASAWVANRIITDLRQEMFEHLLHLPTNFFDHHSSGKLASHVAGNPASVTGAATMALTVLVRDSLTIIGLMAWLLWLNWKLTSITFALFPIIMLLVQYFNKRLRIVSRHSQHSMAAITHRIEEAASNNRVVKIFSAEDFEKERFRKTNEKQRGLSMRATIAESAITPLVQLLASLSVALIINLALNNDAQNQPSAGEFMSFLTALLMLLPPIKRLTDITSTIQRGLASADIIFGMLDEPQEKRGPLSTQVLSGDIVFSSVHYSYNSSKKVIDDFNLTIPEGKTYALIGKSGSGKTTLTHLIAGLYCLNDNEGSISVGGTFIKDTPLQALRNSISIVSQEVRLFNDTIFNNVAYSDSHPDKTKVMGALTAAHAMEFIATLPDGIHTEIGQNGITLSGGQRQRIAIARAFYKNSPILILDEATSALDTESERYIQDALKHLMKNRTSIVIAHRLSTIEHADCIIVMQHGTIKESGSHQELLDNNGLYKSYYQLQFSD